MRLVNPLSVQELGFFASWTQAFMQESVLQTSGFSLVSTRFQAPRN